MKWNNRGRPHGPNKAWKKPVRSQEERNRMTEKHHRLVRKVVRAFYTCCPQARRVYPEDDAFADGFMGLMRAAELYEDGKGAKFSTYAYPWIYSYISKAYDRYGFLIRRPDRQREYSIAFGRGMNRLEGPVCLEDILFQRELGRIVHDALGKIRPRDATVIRMRMEGMILADIAKAMGVSHQRARQIEVRGMDELLDHLCPF